MNSFASFAIHETVSVGLFCQACLSQARFHSNPASTVAVRPQHAILMLSLLSGRIQ